MRRREQAICLLRDVPCFKVCLFEFPSLKLREAHTREQSSWCGASACYDGTNSIIQFGFEAIHFCCLFYLCTLAVLSKFFCGIYSCAHATLFLHAIAVVGTVVLVCDSHCSVLCLQIVLCIIGYILSSMIPRALPV